MECVLFEILEIYANLEPEVHDVDLGHRYRAPFGSAVVGEEIGVNVRIQASSTNDLKAYQIVIMFDDSLVQVDASPHTQWLGLP